MNGPKLLFVASWVLLLLVSAVIAIGSLWSLRVAYFRPADNLSRTVSIEDIRSIGGDEAVQDYRG
ncbi:MAG TPA: hypothetical protein VKM94_24885, partial [Blastocatellia bacterium]|nr:hypothetical protein [Blastocatellia bacterium]